MHPKKNRCITFWGGWKYRGLETNAMTLRHIHQMLEGTSTCFFAFYKILKLFQKIGKQVFDKKLLHVILGGKNMKDQESQREFVILHCRCFCSGKNILLKGEMHGPRSNKRKTNRPSFFRTDFCPITKYFLALSNQFLLSIP